MAIYSNVQLKNNCKFTYWALLSLREISAISLWYAKSWRVGWQPLTSISNRFCWYFEALNNILFSSISAIISFLLFQFLKAQTGGPSINYCEFSVCFLRPDPLLVAAEALGSGGAKFKLRATTANYVVQRANFWTLSACLNLNRKKNISHGATAVQNLQFKLSKKMRLESWKSPNGI